MTKGYKITGKKPKKSLKMRHLTWRWKIPDYTCWKYTMWLSLSHTTPRPTCLPCGVVLSTHAQSVHAVLWPCVRTTLISLWWADKFKQQACIKFCIQLSKSATKTTKFFRLQHFFFSGMHIPRLVKCLFKMMSIQCIKSPAKCWIDSWTHPWRLLPNNPSGLWYS